MVTKRNPSKQQKIKTFLQGISRLNKNITVETLVKDVLYKIKTKSHSLSVRDGELESIGFVIQAVIYDVSGIIVYVRNIRR